MLICHTWGIGNGTQSVWVQQSLALILLWKCQLHKESWGKSLTRLTEKKSQG